MCSLSCTASQKDLETSVDESDWSELRLRCSSSWERWWPANRSSRSPLMWHQLVCWLSKHLPHCLHIVSLLRGQTSAASVGAADAPRGLFYVFLWNSHHKGICQSISVALYLTDVQHWRWSQRTSFPVYKLWRIKKQCTKGLHFCPLFSIITL